MCILSSTRNFMNFFNFHCSITSSFPSFLIFIPSKQCFSTIRICSWIISLIFWKSKTFILFYIYLNEYCLYVLQILHHTPLSIFLLISYSSQYYSFLSELLPLFHEFWNVLDWHFKKYVHCQGHHVRTIRVRCL